MAKRSQDRDPGSGRQDESRGAREAFEAAEDRRREFFERERECCDLPVAELYFATVRAIGTPLDKAVIRPLGKALEAAGFLLVEIKLSDRLAQATGTSSPDSMSRTRRYELLNEAGAQFRQSTNAGDAIAVEAIRYLNESRRLKARQEAQERGFRGVAYLFRSLHHPDEAKRLRKMYGSQLFIISLFSPESRRTRHLQRWLAKDDTMQSRSTGEDAARLIHAESGQLRPTETVLNEERLKYRNNIPETWKHADLFLDIGEDTVADQVTRLVQLIFSDPFRTPRPVEMGMAEAYLAAQESANLARRVGASIVAPDELLLAVGTNNVARPTGGIYRSGAEFDHRDHTSEWEHDPSDKERRAMLRDFVEHLLADPQWLKEVDLLLAAKDPASKNATRKLRAALAQLRDAGEDTDEELRDSVARIAGAMIASEVIWNSQTFDVLEYARSLHAEMDAITSAARKSVSTVGSTLYCTTMPCHECARLIIGAGIKRVYFVEPYDKSRAMELFHTEITLMSRSESLAAPDDGRVHFVPYVGIAPNRFDDVFSWVTRKKDDLLGGDDNGAAAGRKRRKLDGALADWNPRTADVREAIISKSALESRSRLVDVMLHEHQTVADFDRTAAAVRDTVH